MKEIGARKISDERGEPLASTSQIRAGAGRDTLMTTSTFQTYPLQESLGSP